MLDRDGRREGGTEGSENANPNRQDTRRESTSSFCVGTWFFYNASYNLP
jgi:hypothetical protein